MSLQAGQCRSEESGENDGPPDFKLPALREDLQLLPASESHDGAPRWLIYDPLRHKHFIIGDQAMHLLSHWSRGTFLGLCRELSVDPGTKESDVKAIIRFLDINGLIQIDCNGGWQILHKNALSARRGWLGWLLANYLFVRVPLFRPQRFLEATAALVAPLFTATFMWLMFACGAIGIYLVSRQWDHFVAATISLISIEGVLAYAVSLAAVKVIHEFGHAYCAVRHGCRVPTMGVAFLVMYPVMYTDVSDAWRLRRRGQRLLIDAGGVLAELMVAVLATLAWVFLPEGTLRDVSLILATTSWVLTLAINLNPFMRFDGYYFLADFLRVENLGPRSFAVGRWWLRECLFALDEPPPERLTDRLRRVFIGYAWATWIYRLLLFISIAVLVYTFFFKALGIVLFAVELIWFVGMPVGRELNQWWRRKARIVRTPRSAISLGLLLTLFLLLIVPWQSTVSAPAFLHASRYALLYAPEPARIIQVHVRRGEQVQAGQLLIELDSVELTHEMALARERLKLVNARLDRRGGDHIDRQQGLLLAREKDLETERIEGIRRRIDQLHVRAPIAGTVTRLSDVVQAGASVGRDAALLRVVDLNSPVEIKTMLTEESLALIGPGASSVYYPDPIQSSPIAGVLESVSPVALLQVDEPYFSGEYGGGLEVKPDEQGNAVPMRSAFAGLITAPGSLEPVASRGVVRVNARPESLLVAAWRRVSAVLIRESGF